MDDAIFIDSALVFDVVICVHYVFPGLGAGAGATLFGELARISTKKERTKVFSTFTMMRQVGLILGMYECSCTHSTRYTVCCIRQVGLILGMYECSCTHSTRYTVCCIRQVGLILGMYECSCTHSTRYTVCCISYPVCVLNQFPSHQVRHLISFCVF